MRRHRNNPPPSGSEQDLAERAIRIARQQLRLPAEMTERQSRIRVLVWQLRMRRMAEAKRAKGAAQQAKIEAKRRKDWLKALADIGHTEESWEAHCKESQRRLVEQYERDRARRDEEYAEKVRGIVASVPCPECEAAAGSPCVYRRWQQPVAIDGYVHSTRSAAAENEARWAGRCRECGGATLLVRGPSTPLLRYRICSRADQPGHHTRAEVASRIEALCAEVEAAGYEVDWPDGREPTGTMLLPAVLGGAS